MMGRGPLVTIAMPAFRMGAFISHALDSVAAQTHANWELIVIDDHGPEDGTAGIVGAFAGRMPAHRVEFIRHERNLGVSAARNTGIEAGRGEFVAFLDPDDSWSADHLERCLARFQKRPELDVVTGPVEVKDELHKDRGTWIHGDAVWQRRAFPHSLVIYNFIQPSASVVRRTTLEKAGGFDTDPQLQHIEDYDLWIRLIDAGARFAFLDRPSSRYRRHAEGATADRARMRRLDAYLVARHPAFFRESTAALHRQMLSDIARSEERMNALNDRYSGPVMRSIAAADRALRSVQKAIRRLISQASR